MSILEAYALYKKVKPYLKKIEPIIEWFKKTFAQAKADGKFDTVLPSNHPDKKVTPEDIYRGTQV